MTCHTVCHAVHHKVKSMKSIHNGHTEIEFGITVVVILYEPHTFDFAVTCTIVANAICVQMHIRT